MQHLYSIVVFEVTQQVFVVNTTEKMFQAINLWNQLVSVKLAWF